MNINKQFTFLVVDDYDDTCKGIINKMKAFDKWVSCGYERHVIRAIDNIIQNKPELIFLDWDLAGGKAFTVLDYIKSIDNYFPFIIFNSGYLAEHPEIAEKAHNEYNVDKILYVKKPIFGERFNEIENYIKEAESKAIKEQVKNGKFAIIKTTSGSVLKLDFELLLAIEHNNETQIKYFYFANHSLPLFIDINWKSCYDLLDSLEINYYIYNHREGLIIKNYISKVNLPNISITGLDKKFMVPKNKHKEFLSWYRQ